MQKRIITLLCVAGLSISGWAQAKLPIRPDAPARYVVKSGDTLWGISKRYLYKPWYWPQLWGYNRAQIRNPHRIYPGQVLVLSYVNGQPRLGIEGGAGGIPVIKLSPRVREVSSGYGISTINLDLMRTFMQYPQILPITKTNHPPYLVAGPENKVLFSPGDRVYAYGIDKPGIYYAYRFSKDITDPDTKKLLGREVMITGRLATLGYRNSALESRSDEDAAKLPDNEYYTRKHPLVKVPTETAQPMVVQEVASEMHKDDHLIAADEVDTGSFTAMPHAPDQPVRGKVVAIVNGVREAGQFQTITLNKGEADGIDKGTVLSLYKQNRLISTKIDSADNRPRLKHLSIPAEEVGLAMVYRTAEHLSYAVIVESVMNIDVGDTIMEPGHDLDNIGEPDAQHIPNKPEEPHGYRFNQFNSTDPNDTMPNDFPQPLNR